MKKKSVWLVLSCLMVAALLLASCGPAAEEEGVVTPGEEEEVVTGEEAVVTEEKEMVRDSLGRLVEKPQYGGVTPIALGADVMGFDEASTAPYQAWTTNLTTDELFTGDWTKGPVGTGEASWIIPGVFFPHLEVPALATGYDLPDNETIIFSIRQGVPFHDKPPVNGREVNAHDVVFSIKRSFETPTAYNYSTYTQVGEGYHSVTATDDWTVEIKCPPEQQVALLYVISDYVSIVAPEMAEAWGGNFEDWRSSIGTGPFMITDYVPMSSIIFERNPNYWRTDPLHPDNQLPYLDGVKMLVIEDASTRMAALRTGKLDRAGVGWEDGEELLESLPELNYLRDIGTTGQNIFMKVNDPDKPWYDIRVRRALAMAIDQPAIKEDYYGGNAELLTCPITPVEEFQGMYTPLEELPESTRELFEYHPDKARQLLAEAGYPDGFKTQIICTSTQVDLLSIVMANWEDIGVELEIEARESPVWQGIGIGKRYKDMILFYSGNAVPLKFLLFRPNTYLNTGLIDDEYLNEQYDRLLENMADWGKVEEILKESYIYALDKCWWIQAPDSYSYAMWWPWVKNYEGVGTVGYWNTYNYFMFMWLDQDLKKEMGY